jgi:hypothetical protein
MNLNDKIKKHELLIEELNNGVDNLLNENVGLIFKLISKTAGALPKKVYKKALDYLKDEITSNEEEIEELEKEKEEEGAVSDEITKKIETLLQKLEELESITQSLENKKQESLRYKKVVIDFKKKVSLDIESLKSPEFKRNLMGTMYFTVVDIDEDEKYIILKTKGYSNIDDSLFFKIEYNKLDNYVDQKGDINLIYSRYKNINLSPVEGEKKESYFKFVELK